MASQTASIVGKGGTMTAPRERQGDGFFFWVSAALLAILVLGFTPTLYLRPAFDVEPIPGYLYVHGIVLTAWFVWLMVQTSMVRIGRTATHRRLGVIGACIGAACVVAGPLATFGVASRVNALGVGWDADMSAAVPALGVEGVSVIEFVSVIFWGNLVAILVFAALLTTAVLERRNPDAHKRYMILASILLIGPAIARISRIPVLGGEDGPFPPLAQLTLITVVIAHDVMTRRRLHRATLISIGAIMLSFVVVSLLARSQFGMDVVLLFE
jgi:hypothetical protein